MTGFRSLSRAMALGFVRDRASVFFIVLFPLMFLLLFGGLFRDQAADRPTVLQVGTVPVFDQLSPDARGALDEIVEIARADGRADALRQVRQDDAAAAVEQRGTELVVHYSAADRVESGTVRGIMQAFVQQANLSAAGVTTPRYALVAEQVEDESLKAIQYMTPGLLGWAIAAGATFGAALTLVTWRQKKILRRLRLAPVPLSAVVGARIGVSIGVALVQTAVFVGVALLPYFGLRLSDFWWMVVPLVVAGTLAFLAIGLLAGAVAKTPEAASAIANLIVLPMAFLSGAFFPLDLAPAWLRTLSNVFPLKHLVEAMQAVMVRDEGPASVLPALGILLAFTVVVSAVAVRLFRWDDA
jgi:ABC-2 type transport system permease protein